MACSHDGILLTLFRKDLNMWLIYCQTADTSSDEKEFENQSTDRRVSYSPIIIARATNLLVEGIVTAECSLCQLKVEVLWFL